MRVIQCLAHSIESYDMLKMYTRMGIDAFDIGGYIRPSMPHDPKRPPVNEAPFFPDLKAVVDNLGAEDNLGAAQRRIPDELLDWLGDDGAIVYHHNLEERLLPQWPRLKAWKQGHEGRRVIWRSIGQSVDGNEAMMKPLVRDGLERVAYSPKEANIPGYTGHAALIRFGKDPAEWQGWTGENPVVLNISQHDATPHARDVWLNWAFWEEATRGLPAVFAGPHSEKTGGMGSLGYDLMRQWLRSARAYLYTGTQPASYTLGLIEAMMTGVPVVSIGPAHMKIFAPFGQGMFEGHEIALEWSDDPREANRILRVLLDHPSQTASGLGRARAIELFGIDTIAAQWAKYLGVPVPAAVAA